jgi:hypothetical protein
VGEREIDIFTRRSSFGVNSVNPQMPASAMGPDLVRETSRSEKVLIIVANILIVPIIVAPYSLIVAYINFDPKESTPTQRTWFVSWLVVGQILGGVTAGIWRE